MTVFLCLDDNNGMMFNKRRQSRDAAVINRIMELVGDKVLHINSYSSCLFEDRQNIIIDDDLSTAEFCFVENISLADIINITDKLVIYRWNRVYPADMKLDIKLSDWNKISIIDFVGNSHEKITEEVYVK